MIKQAVKGIVFSVWAIIYIASIGFVSPTWAQAYSQLQMASSTAIKLKTTFSSVPSAEEKVIPGSVSVIYKNEARVRIAKKNSITSKGMVNSRLNQLLSQYGVIEMHDLSDGESEGLLNTQQAQVQSMYEYEVPHRQSIHTYRLKKSKDQQASVRKLAAELRGLDTVVTAFPTVQFIAGGAAQLIQNRQTLGSIQYGSYPSDPGFSFNESDHWWFFNRHKIFYGWEVYENTAMPTLAILDDGFDTSDYAIDRPNYLPGYWIDCRTSPCSVKEASGSDLMEDQNGTFSHGTTVASVAASPKNNGQGLSGVAPGAPVLPIKLQNFDNDEIAHGIFRAIDRRADAISMSIQTSLLQPISTNPIVRAAISYAVSAQIPVVVIAGNDKYVNLDTISDWPDAGEIVVGGSENDLTTNPPHSVAWNDERIPDSMGGNGSGSGYGRRAHLTAGAFNIYAPTYEVNRPNDPSSRQMIVTLGTSFAAPMVAATVGMMRKISQANGGYPSALSIRDIVTFSTTLARYDQGYNSGPSRRVIGKGLDQQWQIGIRDLNVYNALSISKHIWRNRKIVRIHNVDDKVRVGFQQNLNSWFAEEIFGNDAMWGVSSMGTNESINMCTYNYGGSYTFGYQIFEVTGGQQSIMETAAGVQGVAGANGNDLGKPNQWLACFRQ